MEHQSKIEGKKSEKQRRVLGCAGWGLLLSIIATGFLWLFDYILLTSRGESFGQPLSFGFLIASTYWFIMFLFPIEIIAMVIGSRTKPALKFWRSAAIGAPSVAIAYSLWIYLLYSSLFRMSDKPKPHGEAFWHPFTLGLTVILGGVLLGLIASYGYWHAGREKRE